MQLSNILVLVPLNQMKSFSTMLPPFWSKHLHLLLLFTLNSLWFSPNSTASPIAVGNETDHLALLKFKESISNDPHGILVSWNSSTHFCNWHGVTCNSTHQRVTELNLQGYQLHGFVSPQVGNLSFLRKLNLQNNSFYGEVPQELGRLLQLQFLFLNNNSLAGEIPTNLTSCTELRRISLSWNNLIGKIPIEIGALRKLQRLIIHRNNLTGQIPPSIWNISSLTVLGLVSNNLEGNIPQEIGRLKNFTIIAVSSNKLSGTLPSSLYNMSSLTVISLAKNQLNGSLPPSMFLTLPNLQFFGISENQLSGPIPTSITNASNLQLVDISVNHFVGQVPSLGKLKDLWFLSLSNNNLGDNSTEDLEFLKSLSNCSKLETLSISNNNFGGRLPNSLGNLSTQLKYLYIGGNLIYGNIPAELGNLFSLTLLSMELNYFEGIIPTTFEKFKKMQSLELGGNKLSGDIPTFISSLNSLFHLGLSTNMLQGDIPSSIGYCQMLQFLDLSHNHLKGTIPLEVFSLSSLIILDLSQNSLSGNLSQEVGRLKNIDYINISKNHLSGNIPGTIGECISLEHLYLQGNSFYGIMPSSLASLKGLQYLDLSRNNLSGSIPEGLQNLPILEYLNVSYNMLEGKVPIQGVFQNASALALISNLKLCGGISELHLPPCLVEVKKQEKHHTFKLIAMIVSVLAFLLMLSCILLSIYWMRKRNKKPSSDSFMINQLDKVSYQSLHHGTNGFSPENLIGSGSFSFVYRGILEIENRVVAIKVLNLQKKRAHRTFIAECNALKNMRHRNLVKILTCCSSIDYKGQEFKAIVFEHLPNGSLERWLHPEIDIAPQSLSLDLNQRLNIITDVASALHYLHYECEQIVVHCDLKPSNVLLDDCMVAHVSDFGLARLLSPIGVSPNQTSTIGIKGTIGYAAPEYGMGAEVSTHNDVYSFGIIILEMLTGRRPTDETFKDGYNLHNYVKISFPNDLIQIVDPNVLLEELEKASTRHSKAKKCLLSLFRIGLVCSAESPKERMSMVDVTKELNLIKSSFLHGEVQA